MKKFLRSAIYPIEEEKKNVPWQLPKTWCFYNPNTRQWRTYHGRLSLALDLAGNLRGKRILDAGCGDGRLSAECIKKGAEVIGIDNNASAILFAKIFVPKGKFQIGSLLSLPYKEQFFDNIFCIETFEHIPPTQSSRAVQELFRVLKRGGHLVLSVPSLNLTLAERPRHYRHFTPSLIEEIFSPHFSIEKFCGQEKKTWFVDFISDIYENSLWQILPLMNFFNCKVFIKYWNNTSIDTAAHILAILRRQ